MPGRYLGPSTGKYKYGFNGKENDNETVETGEGTQDYGFRIYNPALGRFFSVDPLTHVYPFYTPYQFAGNKPIKYVDVDGLEEGERQIGKGPVFSTEKIKGALGVPVSPHNVNFSDENERREFIEENDRRSKNLVNNQQTVDLLNETIGGIVMAPLETAGDIISTGYYASKGDWENASYSAAAIFIPMVSSPIIRMGAPLIKGSIKVFENGKGVLKDAYKIGNYGFKGTKQYKTVLDAVKKGGNFVAKTEDEAINFINEAFPGIKQEAAHEASKYGYRVENVPILDEGGKASGHSGQHINYYDKENNVRGTITIGE
jgi:RHS repeat-associated protein